MRIENYVCDFNGCQKACLLNENREPTHFLTIKEAENLYSQLDSGTVGKMWEFHFCSQEHKSRFKNLH